MGVKDVSKSYFFVFQKYIASVHEKEYCIYHCCTLSVYCSFVYVINPNVKNTVYIYELCCW